MTTLKAVIQDVCIRGVEPKENKNGDPYLLVRFEDQSGVPNKLPDKDMERQSGYKRDVIMDLYIEINQTKNYTNMRIIDAKVKGGNKNE